MLHPIVVRGVGAISRRLKRPELMAVIDSSARQGQRDNVAAQALVAALLKPRSSYIDVGTNRGQWLDAVYRCAPDGQHLAFEPIPELRDEIRERFSNVDLRDAALSASAGEAQFCRYGGQMDGWSGLRKRPGISGESEWIDVRLARLDDEIGELAPVLVKIDVEGAEVDVLLGAQDTLAAHRPHVVFEHQIEATSLYDRTSGEMWSLLDGLGYRVFELQGDGPYARQEFVRAGQAGNVVNWLAAPA